MSITSPVFIITIDTEGDNLWANPQTVTTENATFLPRFQELCERFRFKPTYLVNYEMAEDEQFQSFGRGVLANQTAEIGLHIHPWNSPPFDEAPTNHQLNLIENARELTICQFVIQFFFNTLFIIEIFNDLKMTGRPLP